VTTGRPSLELAIAGGLEALGLDCGPRIVANLAAYLRLLEQWNRTYSLSGVDDALAMVARHLLDSLTLVPLVAGPRILDVGSGAGLPGLPLAMVRDDWHVTLLDSRGRKTRFLSHVVTRLGLSNVTVVQERVERYTPPEKFATLVARAFAALPEFLALTRPLWTPGMRLLVMKGRLAESELSALHSDRFANVRIVPLKVPGLDAERSAIVLTVGAQATDHG
jgi:16S rRNA (guanine527-N7)-methyltransferase